MFSGWRFTLTQLLLLTTIAALVLALGRVQPVLAAGAAVLLGLAFLRCVRLTRAQTGQPLVEELGVFLFGVVAWATVCLISLAGLVIPIVILRVLANLVPNRTIAAMFWAIALPVCGMTVLVMIRVVSGLAEHWRLWGGPPRPMGDVPAGDGREG